MERNALFKLAKEVGFEDYDLVPNVLMCDAELLEAFAKLVADVATAKEREECAKVCDDIGMFHEVSQGSDLCFALSGAIRARAQADRGEA